MILFVGLLYPPGEDKRILLKSKVGLESSANNYQWAVIEGLYQASGEKIRVLNSIPMGIFPIQNSILVENDTQYESEKYNIESFGFVNVPVFKQKIREISIYRAVKRIRETTTEKIVLVVYSLYEPYIKAIKKIKSELTNIICVLIVTDLPGDHGLQSGNRMKKILKKYIGEKAIKSSSCIDAFVLLTEQMKYPLHVGNRPYTVIEGIYNNSELQIDVSKTKKPIILYTGALEESLGITTLLDAFEMLENDDAELWIAGSGEAKDKIIARSNQNPRIKYIGYLMKSEVLRLQRNAAVLVNPRSSDETFTQYSFPSKTMEYLASGTPVVMNRLSCIPEEYYQYLFFPDSNDAADLSKTIDSILKMDRSTIESAGNSAKEFILTKKTSKVQAKKILDLIKVVTLDS